MIHPRGHASANAAEDDVGHDVDARDDGVVALKVDAYVEARGAQRAVVEDVVASYDPHVVGIETEAVPSHDDALGRAHGHAGAASPLEAHAALGTGLLAHVAWLEGGGRGGGEER